MSRLEKTAAAAMIVSFLLLAGVTTRSFVLSRRPDPGNHSPGEDRRSG